MSAPNLTRADAQRRAALLEVESYSIELDLTDGLGQPGEGTFRSTTTVRFRSHEVGATTWIELRLLRVEDAPERAALRLVRRDRRRDDG